MNNNNNNEAANKQRAIVIAHVMIVSDLNFSITYFPTFSDRKQKNLWQRLDEKLFIAW
jgi:hypothetical protein